MFNGLREINKTIYMERDVIIACDFATPEATYAFLDKFQSTKIFRTLKMEKIIQRIIKYDTLFKRLGKAYAEMFIYSIYILEEIPFDNEWEEQYQSLKD